MKISVVAMIVLGSLSVACGVDPNAWQEAAENAEKSAEEAEIRRQERAKQQEQEEIENKQKNAADPAQAQPHSRSMVNNKKGVEGSTVVVRTWMTPESVSSHDLDDAEDSKMGTERGMITEYGNGDVLVNFIVKHETQVVNPYDAEDTNTVIETIPMAVFAPCSEDRKGDFYTLSKRKVYSEEYLKELSYAVLYSCKYEEVYLVLDVNENGKIAFDYFNDSLADQHLYGGSWKILTFQRDE